MKHLLIASLVLAAGCAEPALVEYDTRMQRLVELEETDTTMRPPVEVVVPVEVAEVTSTAKRVAPPVQVTPTEPPPDPVEIVNGLPYRFYDPEPAKQAFYIVTSTRPCPRTKYVDCWDQAAQDAWWPMAKDIMLGESGFCWNRLRGDQMAYPNDGCVQVRQGTHEDAGFGQATAAWWGRNGKLCLLHQVCSKWTIIESPWNSMLYSLVIPMELDGSISWCWTGWAREYHPTCYSAPDSGRYR